MGAPRRARARIGAHAAAAQRTSRGKELSLSRRSHRARAHPRICLCAAINDALGRLARCGAGAGRGRHGRAGCAGRAGGGGGGGMQCSDTGGGRVLCVCCVWWRLCGRRRLCGCGRRRGGGARLHVHRLPQGLQARDEPRLPHDDPPAKAAAVRDGGHGAPRRRRAPFSPALSPALSPPRPLATGKTSTRPHPSRAAAAAPHAPHRPTAVFRARRRTTAWSR